MEDASRGLAASDHLDDILPKEVQFVLAWNPPQLLTEQDLEADGSSPTRATPDTALSAFQTSPIGSSLQAAFYVKHLAPHLILKRVVYFGTLVSTMANTVDQAIQDAVAKRPLPKNPGILRTEAQINYESESFRRTKHRESGVAETYLMYAAAYCRPIASTLALHSSYEHWASFLDWTSDPETGRWAIADGLLYISEGILDHDRLLQNEDEEKKGILEQLASRATTLAIWEMKSLTVGTAQVMEEIVEMGLTHAAFQWKGCTTPKCTHPGWKAMEESTLHYDPGPDPRSPPWTLPEVVPSTSTAANSRPSLRAGLRSASAQSETPARRSYEERSASPAEDGEWVKKKRRRDDSDTSEYEGPLPKKSKTSFMDEPYEPPPGSRKEVNAQSFLQQTWAEAVRNKCTIMVLHSGNHEIIGIRHRETQTLYISHVIEPHSCSNPAYGKIQVGIYIAAIQETMDRARQDKEASEKKARDLPADISLDNEEMNPDEDVDDYSPKGPTRPNKRSRGPGNKGKRKGGREGNEKRHASGKVFNDQALLANAARQNHLCLHFFYDIYDSLHPATFRRILEEPKEALGPAELLTPSVSPGRETTPPPAPIIHITVHSELQPGSTGIVHIGTMAVDSSGPTAKVAVKLAFSKDEKSRLAEEHRIYSHLHSRSVRGIPHDIGLFVDEEPLLDTEGPYVLVMTYAGVSLFRRQDLTSDTIKDSLLATLESIHRANILHGDIRLPNLCVTPSGEAFVIDFGHATESRSRKEKAQEMRELSHILKMELPTKSAAKDVVEKPVLRRSARIKTLEQKARVEPKVKQVRRRKSTRRKSK